MKVVWRWTCSAHAGSGLWWGMSSTSLFGVDQAVLYYRHCLRTSGGLPVVGRNLLEEQDGAVVLASPFRPSFRSIEYFKCTLPM